MARRKGMFQIMKETILSVAASMKVDGAMSTGNIVRENLRRTKKEEFENDDGDNNKSNTNNNSNNNR